MTWQIRRLAVCASTERELERWLQARARMVSRPMARLAVVSRRQRHGHGQQGRPWLSPAGGLWLSAAFPWPADPAVAAPLGLAVAEGLARQLEPLGVAVQIKWPNDLLVDGAKLAGLLPRLRWRGGAVRWAQVGVGLNGRNAVPPGAVNLATALGHRHHPRARPRLLEPRVLAALTWASDHALEPERVLAAAAARLWRPAAGICHGGRSWSVAGLSRSGGLWLAHPDRGRVELTRHF